MDRVRALAKRRPERFHGPVFGQEMGALLGRAKLVWNYDALGQHAVNIRLFEATGAGAVLVTDWKDDLPELFEPDREVVTYRTAAECAEKVRYLLEHDEERLAIAAAGQARTLRDHRQERRIEDLVEVLGELLAEGPA